MKDFPKKFMNRPIKIRCKIPYTNNRNIYFSTLRPLVWKRVGLQPLFNAKDHYVQNSEGSVNYNLSYHNRRSTTKTVPLHDKK